jgi:addiction module HigA family antidote
MAKVLVPGTVLKEKFLDEYHITVAKISEDIGLSPSAIRQLINNKLKISIAIAKRLSKYFDKPVQYWIDLQTQYELAELDKDTSLANSLKKIPKAKKQPAPVKAAPKGKKGPKAGAKKAGAKKAADKKPGRPAKAKATGAKRGPKPGAKKAVTTAAQKKPRKPRTPKAPKVVTTPITTL